MWKEKLRQFWFLSLLAIVRFLVSLRYRVTVEGLESIKKENLPKKGGILFLPNHPAEIDPVVLMLYLWKPFQVRPLVVENFYYLKGFRFFLDLVRAMPFPNLDVFVNSWKKKQVDKLFNEIKDELSKGENFLIYPSGRLKITGAEGLGGASLVHQLLQSCPDLNVVLVRTTGLWGSRFSRALTGNVPNFSKEFLEGAKIILKNLLFFTPRREVKVEIAAAPKDFPYQASKLELNKYLENWYNQYPKPGSEPLTLVSYSFWKSDFPTVKIKTKNRKEEGEAVISPDIQREVIAHLAQVSRRSPHQIERSMHLSLDLGLDSLDVAQLYVFLDEKYDVSDLLPGELQTVEDLLRAASGYKKEREDFPEEKKNGPIWPKESSRPAPDGPNGSTLQESFLLCCDRMKKMTACADGLVGPISYSRFKMTVLILALRIKKLPGDHVGILLPSSMGAYALILACLLAKKVPVMLNWTAGVRSLDHSAELTKLQAVITARRFLNRLDNGDLGKIEESLQFLEDIKESLSLKEKLHGLFLSWKNASSLVSYLKLASVKENDPAVILFTSGTESLPKAVPLTHLNILFDLRSAYSCVHFGADDILYGVLPPFHSFGFAVTGVMPLLSGLKVFYAPDPTDSHGMAHDIEKWKPTLFCCAPSFTRALFRVADPKMLASIRMFITGAEKTPPEMFEFVKKLGPNKCLIEGYGITECSPIVTLLPPEKPPKGVGYPIPGVELSVIDHESLQPLSQGQEGEICIRGQNVFPGYLGPSPSPFIEIQGKKWYRSGDRGYIDTDGALILSGRLKRFVKIAGEMVSLGGLEEELMRLARLKKWGGELSDKGPVLAISAGVGEGDKPFIILYTTFEVSKEDVNAALKECGYGRIVKIAEVKVLKEIPLTGTGKTHYRLLDEMHS